ncbi:MAG: hypothetical protein JWN17_472, partial [Frankiales bacterium]|nr:hypothetical protein [Frankiales bacterium]
ARGVEDLPAALAALSERRVEAGGEPLALDVEPAACARLAPAARVLAYRLVQAVGGDVHVGTTPDGDVLLDLDGGRPLDRPERWVRRARALAGDLAEPPGGLQLRLPALSLPPSLSSSPTPSQPKACS